MIRMTWHCFNRRRGNNFGSSKWRYFARIKQDQLYDADREDKSWVQQIAVKKRENVSIITLYMYVMNTHIIASESAAETPQLNQFMRPLDISNISNNYKLSKISNPVYADNFSPWDRFVLLCPNRWNIFGKLERKGFQLTYLYSTRISMFLLICCEC